ncbi:hypothetical protein [Novosphingobium sp.]|uniref:hypothetical protein n=1 Tax=Novosphingobium sp. TaxID=1874826 RepID=UPI002619BC26|nr:hypothetical protein [Novosphingobium sp.]
MKLLRLFGTAAPLFAIALLSPAARAQYTHTIRSNLFVLDLTPPPVALSLPALQQPLPGASVTVDATPTGATGPYIYQWYFNGAPIPAAQGGAAAAFTIQGNAVNNGFWRVVVGSAAGNIEATFEVQVPGTTAPRFELAIAAFDRASGMLELSFPAAYGRSYSVQRSVDLVSWSTVESGIAGTGAAIVRRYDFSSQPRTFFRAVQAP